MTYDDVKAQFNNILNRTDNTDALTTIFLNQALSRAQRTLRTPPQENVLSATVSAGFSILPVPNDYLKPISMTVNGFNVEYMPQQTFFELTPSSSSVPQYWTRVGMNIQFNPTPTVGCQILLNYYGNFPDFSTSNETTVLGSLSPDMLIYGALSYAADYYLDERGPNFEARFLQIVQDIQNQAYDADGPGVVAGAYQFPDEN